MEHNKMPARPANTPAEGDVRAPTASSASTEGRFVVIFGTKGGVGKTVVATNLAVSLALRLKKPVCLIDVDPMGVGDVAKTLNVSAGRSIAEALASLKPDASLETLPLNGLAAPHISGVHVMTCFSNPRQAGQLDPKLLRRFFHALKHRYAYIVVDGGKTFSEPLMAALDACNLILLVATPDVITLYQTKWALGLVESLLFPSSMVKAILNRAESKGGVGTKDVREAIPCEIIGEIPSDGRVVGTSMNQGAPLVTAYRNTKIADAFSRLTDALLTKPELYIALHDIPRHRRADVPDAEVAVGGETTMWSSRLYATGDGTAQAEGADEIVLMKRRIHERLMEELDLKKLDLATLTNTVQMAKLRQKIEGAVANLLAREMGGVISSHEVRTQLVKEIVDEALGLGPLEELLADPTVTDILVNNKDQIYVERRGKLELTAKKFISNNQVRTVIERIVAPLGRRIDEANPMVDARLPDGSRVNAIISPLSVKGPVLSIRKFTIKPYTLDDLIQTGTLNSAMAQFIRACVLTRRNMVISGGTGSGKTTMLNVVSAFIPEGERIITIEDAAELRLAQTHWVSLEGRPPNIEGKGQVMIRDLFRNALRMRPDRVIIGECRGAETLDMLQAMNTGHDGSITTVHANSPKDVISRFDSMVLMSDVELPVRAIREMVSSAIDVIVHTARLSDGSRKITAISEVTGLSGEGEVMLHDLFAFRQSGVAADGTVEGAFRATGTLPTFLEELKVKGFGLDESLFSGHGASAPHVRAS